MERVIERCCGLDSTRRPWRDWLEAYGVTHVAMESTGVYWKPIFYVLEDAFTCVLANAAQIAQVPGRKTDVMDCVWIAQLLEHGLVRESFVHQKYAKAIAAALSPTSGCSGPGVSATRSRE